jgi:hypothetical protein
MYITLTPSSSSSFLEVDNFIHNKKDRACCSNKAKLQIQLGISSIQTSSMICLIAALAKL